MRWSQLEPARISTGILRLLHPSLGGRTSSGYLSRSRTVPHAHKRFALIRTVSSRQSYKMLFPSAMRRSRVRGLLADWLLGELVLCWRKGRHMLIIVETARAYWYQRAQQIKNYNIWGIVCRMVWRYRYIFYVVAFIGGTISDGLKIADRRASFSTRERHRIERPRRSRPPRSRAWNRRNNRRCSWCRSFPPDHRR